MTTAKAVLIGEAECLPFALGKDSRGFARMNADQKKTGKEFYPR